MEVTREAVLTDAPATIPYHSIQKQVAATCRRRGLGIKVIPLQLQQVVRDSHEILHPSPRGSHSRSQSRLDGVAIFQPSARNTSTELKQGGSICCSQVNTADFCDERLALRGRDSALRNSSDCLLQQHTGYPEARPDLSARDVDDRN